jgi:hypothetical protein
VTYPGYQCLPRGIKQLLLASENFFFEESKPVGINRKSKTAEGAQFPAMTGLGNSLAIDAGT